MCKILLFPDLQRLQVRDDGVHFFCKNSYIQNINILWLMIFELYKFNLNKDDPNIY